MLYLKEICFRVIYCCVGSLNLFIIACLKIKDLQILYFGYVIPFLKKFSVDESIHFIYTSPIEILDTNLHFSFFLAFSCFFLLNLISLYDFLKSSFYCFEFFYLSWWILFSVLLWYTYTNWVFYDGLIILILYLKFFLEFFLNLTYFNIFLELKLLDYIYFLQFLFFYLQSFFIILLFLFIFYNNLTFNFLILSKFYNIYLLFFIVLCLCPPELIVQLFSLNILVLLFEIYNLFLSLTLARKTFYILKILKY